MECTEKGCSQCKTWVAFFVEAQTCEGLNTIIFPFVLHFDSEKKAGFAHFLLKNLL